MWNILAVFIGGGLGSLARYGVSRFAVLTFGAGFPMGTLLANVLSCIVLAITVTQMADKQHLHMAWRLLLIVGFCGGFSTFSTFSYETYELIKSGHTWLAVVNVLLSVSVCLGLIFLLVKKG